MSDYNEIYRNTSIVQDPRMNGRVNLIEPEDPTIQFKMQERIVLKNKSSEYRDALTGELECTPLSNAYFSAENVQIIQNGLRAGVYAKSGNQFVIAPQNVDTLKVIMRSTFLQYAEHKKEDVPGQIAKLNDIVLGYAIHNVYNEAVSYIKYREDQSTIAVPLERPRQVDRDFKHIEKAHWV
jgi:hypothetical protein